MSRENEPASAIPPKQQSSQVAREKNVTVFRNFKHKLANLQTDLDKWLKVMQTFRDFVRDARIYYDEARPDIVDCVEIATNAVMALLPAELQHLRPVHRSNFSGLHRITYDELRRLLVVVGSYQPEIVNPHKGGEPRHDLLSRLTTCIAAFGIYPDFLLEKASLEGAMSAVTLDGKSQQTIFASIARRRSDAMAIVSSTRSTPSLATPVLSLPSPHTSASPQIVAPTTPTAYSGPAPIPMHVAAPHLPPQAQAPHPTVPVPSQAIPSPTTPSSLASPVQQTSAGAPKPRKSKWWMKRDLDEFREGKKMAKPGVAPVTPVEPSVSTTTPQSPSLAAPVQTPIVTPSLAQPSKAQIAPSDPATMTGPNGSTSTAPDHTTEVEDDALEAMDVDTAPLDGNAPLPYLLPPGPYAPGTPQATWGDLFADAINSSHERKLTIGQMIQYVATVYPGLKGIKPAAGAMFNSKMAKQTGKATKLQGMVQDEIRIDGRWKTHSGPRFVRVSNVFPHTWTLENMESTPTTSPTLPDTADQPLGKAEEVVAEKPTTLPSGEESSSMAVEVEMSVAPESSNTATSSAPPEVVQDTPMSDATTPALTYALPPGPYSSPKPSRALAVLIQEAILAGTPEKRLTQPDVISYIRTVHPFYASYPDLESEVSAFLQQHFAPKDDGPQTQWSLWIRDGSDEARPLPFTLPSGPRLSSKPDRPLQSFITEAILASPENRLTQRDVAAYVLSVVPYYNGADEPLPFGQLLREHFVQHGSDSEGRALWGIKDDEELAKEDERAPGGDWLMLVEGAGSFEAAPNSPIVAQDEGRPTSARPISHEGHPENAIVVESDEESDLEPPSPGMLSPITPLTANTVFPSPVEVPSPSTGAPSRPVDVPPPRLTSHPYFLPSGPYSSHKPPKTNEALIVEALLASPNHQLQKKDIATYLQTVYPWFRRDERAILACKRMVEAQVTRLNGKERVTRVGKGMWALQDTARFSATPSSLALQESEAEDESMDDVPKLPARRSTGSPVLTIRIPPRPPVSGDASAVSQKRSAPSASPARSASPSLLKKIKLIVRDKSGAISPPRAQSNGDATTQAAATSSLSSTGRALEPKVNGAHAPEAVVSQEEAVVSSIEQVADVEMQDIPEVAKAPELPPLPPVSFGQEACLVDVAFGRPAAASFALHVHPHPEQWDMLEMWRNSARNDSDVSQALCYSLVCYRSEDVHLLREDVAADAWGDTLARTEIPVSLHNEALRSLCLTGNGRTVPFPLTWMAGTASPLFLDISSYLVSGDNILTLAHTMDLSAFTFAIVVHRPNAHQLRWLDARREPWRRFQAQLGQSLQIPKLDHDALLLSSRDVSQLDLNRGVSRELLTIS